MSKKKVLKPGVYEVRPKKMKKLEKVQKKIYPFIQTSRRIKAKPDLTPSRRKQIINILRWSNPWLTPTARLNRTLKEIGKHPKVYELKHRARAMVETKRRGIKERIKRLKKLKKRGE